MHLHYSCMSAGMKYKENRHAQKVMRELGITYQHATPQSMYDCWQFWNCENVPEELPGFITQFKRDPMTMIGYGLSEESAIAIRDYEA